jgi:hypothetical protein
MADDLQDSPIQVYCTVRKDELEATAEGLQCVRCQKTLREIKPGEPTPGSGCGFIRRASIPLIASSLALSGCTEPTTAPEPGPTPPTVEQPRDDEEMILAGVICPPPDDPKPIIKSDYPTAERVVGRPKWITSPYTGDYIDVEGLTPGSLAMDPKFKPAERKYFVIPPEAE